MKITICKECRKECMVVDCIIEELDLGWHNVVLTSQHLYRGSNCCEAEYMIIDEVELEEE
jgi:hypothetical protein